ncbi:MAG: hypothetical protein B0D96_01205 [Candidatus Sedimenticola endophacoides]|uniref:Peptidyl-prolyl cis-trans isomerase n=2 Tax=Candidatus Sedimenticola endophacoides TaxID=2548426 RepID=A0A657Q661_9GAMM|nr:MAG: hypothetical protein B0D94_11800 [Candidatus Sedimenticola endophacoides]OQX37851.1 MAG: hypothetical protein B0D96_01205 [Candidatus Sedimenticola endophacoides]OQX40131.1 MAG: hypothetical protein B0D89_08900 [Candidatus Sedimenticola endophacoides]OQX43080.1 MAG: hypothetical protein B0D88_05310 [Candidatus Sedimenticola endophacoides]OQX46584.1 MAG: hypothetical protein B0D86_01395 [Candidatus Sedimenticola endophacoides]
MSPVKRVFLAALMVSVMSPAIRAAELQSTEQQYSYTLGYQLALRQLSAQPVAIDGAALGQGVTDALAGSEPRLSLEQMQAAIDRVKQELSARKQAQAEQALAAGRAFLAENARQTGVVTLENGLQYRVLKEGSGEAPGPEETVTVHYRGTLIDGTEFDSSYGRGEPTSFPLDAVVPGFREAITRMRPGARWQVFMPSELAYGAEGAGASIGPNETLIFEIELISIDRGE